jgi:hypothetical protein
MRSSFLRKWALPSLLVAVATSHSPAAQAQFYGYYRPVPPPLPVYEVEIAPHPMTPVAVALILNRLGFHEMGRLELRGETYRVTAIDRARMPVIVVLDAYDGDILDIRARPLAPGLASPPQHTADTARATRAAPPKPPQRPLSLAASLSPSPTPKSVAKQPAAAYPPAEPEVLRGLARQMR